MLKYNVKHPIYRLDGVVQPMLRISCATSMMQWIYHSLAWQVVNTKHTWPLGVQGLTAWSYDIWLMSHMLVWWKSCLYDGDVCLEFYYWFCYHGRSVKLPTCFIDIWKTQFNFPAYCWLSYRNQSLQQYTLLSTSKERSHYWWWLHHWGFWRHCGMEHCATLCYRSSGPWRPIRCCYWTHWWRTFATCCYSTSPSSWR